ncbi:hypothetical protein R1flu_025647 [Riccia fluitans]|uniref:(S)-ureidoglycine aminohydrolase cupin domain-containing protein n=1 Tax=Riccia fluitans TaxID=41844 RepID=A0ABD1XYB9_9MARC
MATAALTLQGASRSAFLGATTAPRNPLKEQVGVCNIKVPTQKNSGTARGGSLCVFARIKRPVEERYGIQHEKNVTAERLKELGVERWSTWECGPNVTYRHEWQVDELVYISKGSVMVTPADCDDDAYFYQGDIVRFPKWLVADLTFDEDYEQRYRFLAYGD